MEGYAGFEVEGGDDGDVLVWYELDVGVLGLIGRFYSLCVSLSVRVYASVGGGGGVCSRTESVAIACSRRTVGHVCRHAHCECQGTLASDTNLRSLLGIVWYVMTRKKPTSSIAGERVFQTFLSCRKRCHWLEKLRYDHRYNMNH